MLTHSVSRCRTEITALEEKIKVHRNNIAILSLGPNENKIRKRLDEINQLSKRIYRIQKYKRLS